MIASGSRSITLGLAIGCALAAVLLRAGQNAGTQGQPVFRVTTRLVVLNVVVHDKKGAPVTGLTSADFTILDGGKKQQVAVFSVEASPGVQRGLKPLPADVFSNRVGEQGAIPTSVAVILLDGLDTRFEDQVYARGQLIKFLAQLQPQDCVALYVLGQRGLSVVQDFTSDPAPLVEAIRRYGGRFAPPPGSKADNRQPDVNLQGLSGPAALARTRLDAGLSSFSYLRPKTERGGLAYWHLRTVLNAFESIAHRLSGLPGHKTLVWVTGDVPDHHYFPHLFDDRVDLFRTGWPGLSKEILETAQAVKQADLAIYPVNARGLVVDPAYSAEARGPSSPGAGLEGLNTANLGMHYIADQTGGRAFYNTNDLKGALRNALDDSEVTYTLGYYPTHGQWDGRYRPIKVVVDRKGVEVRHRQGYFASPPPAGSVGTKDRMAMLKEAALNPLEATGVGVTVRVTLFTGPTSAHKLEIEISPDLSDLTFQQVNGRWTGLFDVLAGQYSKQGKSLGGTKKTLSENLTNATYQEIMRKGLTITFYQDVARRAEELHVVVRDGPSGTLGSVRIPLHNSP